MFGGSAVEAVFVLGIMGLNGTNCCGRHVSKWSESVCGCIDGGLGGPHQYGQCEVDLNKSGDFCLGLSCDPSTANRRLLRYSQNKCLWRHLNKRQLFVNLSTQLLPPFHQPVSLSIIWEMMLNGYNKICQYSAISFSRVALDRPPEDKLVMG